MIRKSNMILLFLILSCTFATAKPARRGILTLTQPDGYSFSAILIGDEHSRMMTTADGAMIGQDSEGWWCYSWYDSSGDRHSTPERVCEGSKAPAASLNQTMPSKTRRLTTERNMVGRLKATTRSDVISKHGIVILVQYQDKKMTYTKEDFVSMLTEKGYSRNGATGCAKDYFDDQFGSGWDFNFDVSSVQTLSKVRGWYGANNSKGEDIRAEKMIEEACTLADAEIDFSKYDDDADGVVENVFVFFAGEDESDGADEECIWSHSWYLGSGAGISLTLDGKKIDSYACSSELSRHSDGKYHFAGIGTFCHEFAHTLGLPDFYDTDYCGEGQYMSAGLWFGTSLMDAGNLNNEGNTPPYLNAVEREYLGLAEGMKLEPGEHTLEPIGNSGDFYKIETDREGEYYLIECRGNSKWDKYINGDGMLVYHIDKTGYSAGYSEQLGTDLTAGERWIFNEINANPDHLCADLVEADGRSDKIKKNGYTTDIYGIFYPSGDNDILSSGSKPPMSWWSGEKAGFMLRDIRRNGESIIFTAKEDESEEPPAAVNLIQDIFQDAAILCWSSDRETDGPSYISWGTSDGSKKTEQVQPYAPGCYAITLDGLSARTSYSCELYFKSDGVPGEKTACNFTTKSSTSGDPYIYLKGTERNEDGSFPAGSKLPLRVFNAVGSNVIWTMNGKSISTGTDGYYSLPGSGTLKAEIIYSDGNREYIIKKIVMDSL